MFIIQKISLYVRGTREKIRRKKGVKITEHIGKFTG